MPRAERRRARLAGAAALAVAVALAGWPRDAAAQAPRRSQRAAVMQMVGATRIEIAYSRPVARGRELFGALVPWGRPWNPGADTATTIALSAPVRVNGAALPAGTYSLWAIPGEREWTLIFSRAQPVWHTPYPAGRDALRVQATPQRGAHMETLAFYFPVVEGRTAVLHLHWGETVVPLRIDVEGAVPE
ncbi:MAG TPA: DUF2911 domain-containing protein [Gemmatimonadaceae bacterium]|nr:DUF2911 domain-containing protein [Gemmatimonadaceae bacterium]